MTRDAAREADPTLIPRLHVFRLMAEERAVPGNDKAALSTTEWRILAESLRDAAALLAEIAALRRALDNISGIVSDGRADDVARADIAEELRCLAEESVPTPPAGGAHG